MGLAATVAMQGLMGTDFVHRFGTEEHKQSLLAPALQGEKIGSIAMTEPGPARTWARSVPQPCEMETSMS